MLGNPLGLLPFTARYQPNIPPPTVVDQAAGGNAGLAWLVELEPVLRTTAVQHFYAAALSGLAPLGLTGLGAVGDVPRRVAVPAGTRRYASLARGVADSTLGWAPNKLDRDRIEVRRELPVTGDRLSGFIAATVGTVVLDNADGGLDGFVADEVMRDRPVRLKVAPSVRAASGVEKVAALDAFATVFAGRANDVQVADGDRVQVRVADDITRLDRPLQGRLYGGTGGKMGGPELAGQPIPLSYGSVKGVRPVLVDALRLIYQVHDGEFLSILARDKGQALVRGRDVATFAELAALTVEGEADDPAIPAGAFATCRAEGFFRLGVPAAGVLTCDVEGDGLNDGPIPLTGGVLFTGGVGFSSPGRNTHRRFAGGMLFRLLSTRGFFAEAEIDVARIAQFDQENPWPLGLYVGPGDRPTVREACTRIADSVGAVILRNQRGQLFPRALIGPGTSSPIEIGGPNLAADGIERVALPWGAPWWNVRVRWGRQWAPLAQDDLAADLDEATAAEVRQEWRLAEALDPELQAIVRDRAPLELDTLLTREADALAMAARLQRFYAGFWGAWRVTARGLGFRTDPLDTVVVTHPRYGLAAGQPMLVIAVEERPGDYETELTLLG